MFVDYLKTFTVPQSILPLIKLQLVKIFNHYNEGSSKNDLAVKAQIETLNGKMKDLKIRHGLGEIDQETYNLTLAHLSVQLRNASQELNTLVIPISTLEKLLISSLEKLRNIDQIWVSGDLETKRRVQKAIFPDGILYDVKEHRYLTTRTNTIVHLTNSLSNSYRK